MILPVESSIPSTTLSHGYKIILDFPQQNDCKMEETSLKEVKQIMLTLLKEQTIQDM